MNELQSLNCQFGMCNEKVIQWLYDKSLPLGGIIAILSGNSTQPLLFGAAPHSRPCAIMCCVLEHCGKGTEKAWFSSSEKGRLEKTQVIWSGTFLSLTLNSAFIFLFLLFSFSSTLHFRTFRLSSWESSIEQTRCHRTWGNDHKFLSIRYWTDRDEPVQGPVCSLCRTMNAP